MTRLVRQGDSEPHRCTPTYGRMPTTSCTVPNHTNFLQIGKINNNINNMALDQLIFTMIFLVYRCFEQKAKQS